MPGHPSEHVARSYAGAEQETRWISSTRSMRSTLVSLCALSQSSWHPPTGCIRPDLNGSSCSQVQTHNVRVGHREAKSTEGVPDTYLLNLACLIVSCCQHPRSLQSHGTFSGPPRVPAPPCSAEGCVGSGPQRLHWFCFTRCSIVVDMLPELIDL